MAIELDGADEYIILDSEYTYSHVMLAFTTELDGDDIVANIQDVEHNVYAHRRLGEIGDKDYAMSNPLDWARHKKFRLADGVYVLNSNETSLVRINE